MALREKLDGIREMAKTRIPPEARAIMGATGMAPGACPSRPAS
jgi:hypothetical protein